MTNIIRTPITPQPKEKPELVMVHLEEGHKSFHFTWADGESKMFCTGDTLMLGEEWRVYEWDKVHGCVLIQYTSDGYIESEYAEESKDLVEQLTADFSSGNKDPTRIRPAHTLPIELRRKQVDAVNVRAERLQSCFTLMTWVRGNGLPSNRELWNDEHPNYPWESNPWVWMIETKEL